MIVAIQLIGVVFPSRLPRTAAQPATATASGDVSAPAGGSRPKDE